MIEFLVSFDFLARSSYPTLKASPSLTSSFLISGVRFSIASVQRDGFIGHGAQEIHPHGHWPDVTRLISMRLNPLPSIATKCSSRKLDFLGEFFPASNDFACRIPQRRSL